MLLKIVFFFVISAITITSAWGLQCYSCDSRHDQNCSSPFNTSLATTVDCTSLGGDTCTTYTATVANEAFTARTCTNSVHGKPCKLYENAVADLKGSFKNCYSCQKDYCNSSNSLSSVLLLITTALVIHSFCNKL